MSTAPGAKRGRVKFFDQAKGYGYLIEDGQPNPRTTVLFRRQTMEGPVADLGHVAPGAVVEYWLNGEGVVRRMKLAEPEPAVPTTPWTHAEAKTHTVVERLLERCRAYGKANKTCSENSIVHEDWCERCLAAERLQELGEK